MLCAALLLLGMLAGGLITLTFRQPVVVTVQMEKSQHDYANRGKMPVEPGSSAMPKSAKAKARREPWQTQTDGTFFKNRHHFAIFLDDGEAVYHKTSDCAKRHATRVELIKEILPCGVLKTVWLKELSGGAKLRSQDCEDVSFLGASANSDSHVSLLASEGLVSFTCLCPSFHRAGNSTCSPMHVAAEIPAG